MPEIAFLDDNPATEPYHAQWGRMGAIKSAQVRRENKEKLAQLEALIPQALGLATARPNPIVVDQRACKSLQTQMRRFDKLMAKCDKPTDLQALAMARERLFNQWAHLAGIPKPMAPREPRSTRRTIQSMSQPIELAPVPAPIPFDYSGYKLT